MLCSTSSAHAGLRTNSDTLYLQGPRARDLRGSRQRTGAEEEAAQTKTVTEKYPLPPGFHYHEMSLVGMPGDVGLGKALGADNNPCRRNDPRSLGVPGPDFP